METFNAISQFQQPAITDGVVAGNAAKTRKELEKVIGQSNSSMFDIASLLFKIKQEGLYKGYTTFSSYLDSLKFKRRRLDYLVKMAEVLDAVNVSREKYEPIGLSKLRAITSFKDINGTWKNPETGEEVPLKTFILAFIEKGQEMSLSEIQQHVRTLKGEVGEEAFAILHIKIKLEGLDKVVRPALQLMKMKIGSTGKDSEGNSLDASDGRALELICAEFLSDPNNSIEENSNGE